MFHHFVHGLLSWQEIPDAEWIQEMGFLRYSYNKFRWELQWPALYIYIYIYIYNPSESTLNWNLDGPQWCLANISSGNGLVPSGTKPSPEPMFTKFYDAIWCHSTVGYSWLTPWCRVTICVSIPRNLWLRWRPGACSETSFIWSNADLF